MFVSLLLLSLCKTVESFSCNNEQLELFFQGAATSYRGACASRVLPLECDDGCLYWGKGSINKATMTEGTCGFDSSCQCCFLSKKQYYQLEDSQLKGEIASGNHEVHKLKARIADSNHVEQQDLDVLTSKLKRQIEDRDEEIKKLQTQITSDVHEEQQGHEMRFALNALIFVWVLITCFLLVKAWKKRRFALWPPAQFCEPLLAEVQNTSEVAPVIEEKDREIEELKEKISQVENEFEKEVGSMIKLQGGRLGKLGSDFDFLIYDDSNEVESTRIIKIQCSGVSHGKINCEIIFNGCIVTIQREASIGIEAATWTKKFQFRLSDGLFELLPERMELEQGIFTIVFRTSTFVGGRVQLAERYCMNLSDYEHNWILPPESTANGAYATECAQGGNDDGQDASIQRRQAEAPRPFSFANGAIVNKAESVASVESMTSWNLPSRSPVVLLEPSHLGDGRSSPQSDKEKSNLLQE